MFVDGVFCNNIHVHCSLNLGIFVIFDDILVRLPSLGNNSLKGPNVSTATFPQGLK